MDIATAKSAALIAAQIEGLQALIADIDVALAESEAGVVWHIVQLKVVAPEKDSAKSAGTVLDLLPLGAKANAENSIKAIVQARATYQAALDALNAQLAGM